MAHDIPGSSFFSADPATILSKMTRGLIIGKFYPPHKGHSFLIESALTQVDDLVVIVCDHPRQKIRGELRAQWLREMQPSIRTQVVPDTVPGDDSEGWAKYTVEFLGYVPDVVFTSEAYGDAYAHFLGCRHVNVDAGRFNVSISATRIRNSPFSHWDFLAPCVRSFFAKRVCIIGAESTGKTTLAQALSAHYRTAWVPEFGRTYWEGKLSSQNPATWTTQEFVFIAGEQNSFEDQLARICTHILICDTDSFATSVWHHRYMGFFSLEVDALFLNRNIDLYLLTGIEIPFVQDGTRDGEHIRASMHQQFIDRLSERGKRFQLLTGSPEARLQSAIAACETVLHESSILVDD
jgi:HTH-type transcriptional regulator, transcriptional repressor of NAD biosynthesis genes